MRVYVLFGSVCVMSRCAKLPDESSSLPVINEATSEQKKHTHTQSKRSSHY